MKTFIQKMLQKALAVIGLFTVIMPFSAAFADSAIAPAAYGVDTIAGYTTLLTTSQTTPNADGSFYVKKPDNSIITVPFKADQNGIGKADFSDFHTHEAGQYAVVAKLTQQNTVGGQNFFTVYPETLSASASTIKAQRTIAKADGNDLISLTVHLQDSFANPLSGRMVNLLSSRSEDHIQTVTSQATTDNNGDIVFSVSSNKAGVSTFSAFDATSNSTLTSRIQGAFFEGNNYGGSNYLANVGGNDEFMPVAFAADPGQIYGFDISEIPDTIQPDQNVSFRITAQDQNKNTVQNYTGTIHISSDSANATLPQDYTFTAEDLGTHQFNLGLKFSTTGNYKITVTDINNQVIKGEKSVTVGSQNGSQQNNNNPGAKPTIATPAPGTFSQNIQTISGKAPAGSTIKIFDNTQEIGSVQTSPAGTYTFQTGQLTDGKHKVYVAIVNNNQVQGTSDTLEFAIDTTPPQVDDVKITPATITPGSVIQVAMLSEANLQQAAIVFKGEIIPLSPSLDQDTTYVGSFQAPAETGNSSFDVVVVDQLGNEATYEGKGTLVVSPEGTQPTQVIEPPPTQETQAQTQETQVIHGAASGPSQVLGVIGYGSNKRVTLVWEAAHGENEIDHYRIYYGLDPANLDQTVNTKDASTTWYIPNLENGKEYYFAVTAVDNKSVESTEKSELNSAIPFNLEVSANLPEKPQNSLGSTNSTDIILKGAALEDPSSLPHKTSDSGPEVFLLLGASGLSGAITLLKSKKRKK